MPWSVVMWTKTGPANITNCGLKKSTHQSSNPNRLNSLDLDYPDTYEPDRANTDVIISVVKTSLQRLLSTDEVEAAFVVFKAARWMY